MTAEILVMNAQAVALAADSAVSARGGQKIFTSANKIFALSYRYPVGIMIYNNASLLDMPWETVVKAYRSELGGKCFDKLEEYANHFISWLEQNNLLFPSDMQSRFLSNFIAGTLSKISSEIQKRVNTEITQKGSIDDRKVKEIVSSVFDSQRNFWSGSQGLGHSITLELSKDIIARNKDIITQVNNSMFQNLPISDESSNILFEIAANILSKGTVTEFNSGVVITGFGDKEYLPSMEAITVDGIVDNKLKYHARGSARIAPPNQNAGIFPFAQGEMVARYMEGVDPIYRSIEQGFLSEVFKIYPEKVVQNLVGIDESLKEKLRADMLKIGGDLASSHENKIKAAIQQQFVLPILAIVSALPKADLAALAEALVNLTVLKRKFSSDAETVKEPIDVSLISKDEGFIWIKRKHYFNPDLNPHFVSKYLQERSDE